MAKIRKFKLSWDASGSKHVAGYKLYWSKGKAVSYDSDYIKMVNLTEIILPDDIPYSDSPLFFGVTAIDSNGNESDMTTVAEPYQFFVPQAPLALSLEPLDEYEMIDSTQPYPSQLQNVVNIAPDQNNNDDPLADAIESHGTDDRQK